MTTAAGVHGRDQLNAGRIADMGIGSGDHHLSGLQRLAQTVEGLNTKFRQFVKEQDAIMGQRHLTGLGLDPSPRQGCHGGGMVRCPKGSGTG